ncbi:MAG: DNA translocase FtsK [bacterium]
MTDFLDIDQRLYELAKTLALAQGHISVEDIQRHIGTGYARGAHLIDLLEENKIIESGHIDAPRKVLFVISSLCFI